MVQGGIKSLKMILALFLLIATADGFFCRVPKRVSCVLVKQPSQTVCRQSGQLYSTLSADEEEDYESESWSGTFSLLGDILKLPPTPITIVELCDRIDRSKINSREKLLLSLRRQTLLSTMLLNDRTQYLETVKFLGPRIPRNDLPNLQDVPYFNYNSVTYKDNSAEEIAIDQTTSTTIIFGSNLIEDCALPNVTYVESPLDILLLGIFRGFVQKEVSFKSETAGIKGLLEEGKHYYLSELGSNTENQHAFVRRTLGALLTPLLPPFYRIFMAGIIPSKERGDPIWLADGTLYLLNKIKNVSIFNENKWIQENLVPGSQLGPLFYAPLLTSIVTPPFLNFLVGPSRTNRRIDGQVGGIVVEKCKFLQESGCKGLCLHQCKLPAQQFFKETLGLSLTVIPDFNTQACQWSWGQEPMAAELDPAFPKGCLSGCPTRSQMKEMDITVKGGTICNA